MDFQLTETEITIGADRYDLKALNSFKCWLGDDGKTYLKIVPVEGKHEMYEVEPTLTFRNVDGEIVSPDYFIITWRRGMAKPECVIRVGEATGSGAFEQAEPKPEKKKRSRAYDFGAQGEEEKEETEAE